ncbi:heterogeneous nuclear ribonucleoprotein 27C isoform X4 [Macrosteles quadrilineatus]|uniref:heterogeneous nuclear ribonucleoprotein 27C isoform X4 n=1 Tax=Macrosteles quadrilineatus TaxID=74068 RepID=UPI0023E1D2EF|nr:heterogeneous nuclear ribonucleoprotein 27C isoform X4 [Macrosteles quadrilineatus]
MRVKNELDEDEQGKLFVGGLSWETTQENLQRYFSRYGEVIDCVVMKNSESGRSRGFGFVTFADPANVTLVLQNGPHQLDGRTIDPKPCNPRTLQKPKRSSSYPKVFLGGLPSNVTETDLRTYFMRFGKVMEVVIMYDQEKKKSRGFGFLSFEDEESVERCVSEHFVNLSGKQVEIKKAEPRDSSKMNDNSGANQWGPPQNAGHMAMGGGMGMGTPSGQMGGPMGGMGPMGPGNMMQSYQSWGSTPQTGGYPGYGTPSGPGGYQNWGAPPGPQGQQMAPPQWGPNYPSQQTGYGSYGPNQTGYGNNWNWNMPQNGPTAQGGPPAAGAPGPQSSSYAGDMYSGGAAGAAPAGPTPPAAPQKAANDYAGYGGYTGYQQDSSSYGGGRSYAGPDSAQGSGDASPIPSATAKAAYLTALSTVPDSAYSGAPGPQRGNSYTPGTPSFHPYRR